MTIATVVAAGTAWLQVHYGFVNVAQTKIFWITVLLPYVVVLGGHFVIRFLAAPYHIHKESETKLVSAKLERDRYADNLRELEQKYFDERPLIGIEASSVEGIQTWRNHPSPVAFSIHHLSGRVPTAIQFDPILSLSGNFVLYFDSIPHIEKHGRGIEFRVERVGDPHYSAHDLELFKNIQADMLRHFLNDSPAGQSELKYRLVAHFKDRGEDRNQRFNLIFNTERFLFLPNTAT